MSVQVASVKDGDTIAVTSSGKLLKIRFACIDAPEEEQNPWGTTSTSRLKTLLPKGQTINLRVVDTDRYGRTVAEVFKAGKSINLQMVAEGQAVVYPQYINGCAGTKNQYLQSESQAKQQRLGFWNQVKPVMPWNVRKAGVAIR
ncbi:thermonuclease family protein [Trichocoleus sp. DQ-U1]|uniref:thermonuclease family protein n=1 Tax=Trichocoleus sp. DQ-U1 TaxID=2933926 RepID=UPI003299AB6B